MPPLPRGYGVEWYHSAHFNDGQVPLGRIQRRDLTYVPFQSVFDTSGRYGYDPSGPQWPQYCAAGGVGDYGTAAY